MLGSGLGYNDQITYWAPTGKSLYGAQNVFSAPVTILGRWEDKQEQAISADGQEFITKAVVYVPQRVLLGGYIYQGSSIDLNPFEVADAHEIRGLITIPDLRNVIKERRALL